MGQSAEFRGRRGPVRAFPILEQFEERTLLSFLPAVHYNAGIGPHSVALGDFDGNGISDLAVANETSGDVSVLLGRGDGTFQGAMNYPAGIGPQSVAAGDFDRNGILDLAVANITSGDVSILLGNGDGTFQASVNYPAVSGPHDVAVADLNRDGKLDLVVTNFGSTTISVLLGNGDGTFQSQTETETAQRGPHGLAIGDFNRDGVPDLAVVNNLSDRLVVLFGNGNGTFRVGGTYGTESQPTFVVAGDFDRNGVLDLAVANIGANTVGVYLGNPDGTFQNARSYTPGVAGLRALAVGDFNRDGILDLVTANETSGDGSVLLGSGNGTFQLDQNYPANTRPWSVAVADFNGDGYLDLTIADAASNSVSVLLNAADWSRPRVIAYWRLEEGIPDSGATGANTILDYSGNELHGTPFNVPVYRSDVAANPVPRTGDENALSMQFNGTNQRVFIPDDRLFRLTRSLTIEAYIKLTAWPAGLGQILFRGDDRSGLDPYLLEISGQDLLFHVESNGQGEANLRSPPGSLQLNRWYHVAGSLDDATGEMRLYIDGDLVATQTTTLRPFALLNPTSNPGLGIGNNQSASYFMYFPGFIDEVRLSEGALPPEQFLNALPGLKLTQAGLARGYSLSVFASGFAYRADRVGTRGIAFPNSGGVLVSDIFGNVRLFPTDDDGQRANWFPPSWNYGEGNAFLFAQVGSNIYMTQRTAGTVVQVNDDGTFNREIVRDQPFAYGIVANPANGHLFISTQQTGRIVDIDPTTQTVSTFVKSRGSGLLISEDGTTLYVAIPALHRVVGFDIATARMVFDTDEVFVDEPAAIVQGTGALSNKLYVNTVQGTVIELDLTTQEQVVIAAGGTWGAAIVLDPYDGSMLVTQTDRIVRIRFPQRGGSPSPGWKPPYPVLALDGIDFVLPKNRQETASSDSALNSMGGVGVVAECTPPETQLERSFATDRGMILLTGSTRQGIRDAVFSIPEDVSPSVDWPWLQSLWACDTLGSMLRS